MLMSDHAFGRACALRECLYAFGAFLPPPHVDDDTGYPRLPEMPAAIATPAEQLEVNLTPDLEVSLHDAAVDLKARTDNIDMHVLAMDDVTKVGNTPLPPSVFVFLEVCSFCSVMTLCYSSQMYSHLAAPYFSDWFSVRRAFPAPYTNLGLFAGFANPLFFVTLLGQTMIKKAKMSPDGFVQAAFQIAFRRAHPEFRQKNPSVYESCSMRAYLTGRTETIRPTTDASAAAVEAFCGGGESIDAPSSVASSVS